MRVLVTGANGFMGSHLVAEFAQAGHQVRAMVEPGTDTSAVEAAADEITGLDVRDTARLPSAVCAVECVVHLAAVVSDFGAVRRYRKVNVGGTGALLEAAIRAGVRRFVFMSSLAVHELRPVPVAVPHSLCLFERFHGIALCIEIGYPLRLFDSFRLAD